MSGEYYRTSAVQATRAIRQTFRFISHYERLLDSGVGFSVDDRSIHLHEDERAINLYMMLQDFKEALSGDLEWEPEE